MILIPSCPRRGFPFASATASEESTGSVMMNNCNFASGYTWAVNYKYSGAVDDEMRIYLSGDAVSWKSLRGNEVPQNTSFIGTITYRTFS